VRVYHGTILTYAIDISSKGVDLSKSKKYLDFGRGFYTTPDIKMVKDMARRVSVFVERTRKMWHVFRQCYLLNMRKGLIL